MDLKNQSLRQAWIYDIQFPAKYPDKSGLQCVLWTRLWNNNSNNFLVTYHYNAKGQDISTFSKYVESIDWELDGVKKNKDDMLALLSSPTPTIPAGSTIQINNVLAIPWYTASNLKLNSNTSNTLKVDGGKLYTWSIEITENAYGVRFDANGGLSVGGRPMDAQKMSMAASANRKLRKNTYYSNHQNHPDGQEIQMQRKLNLLMKLNSPQIFHILVVQ